MQTFKDTATGLYWQFDDTDDVRLINDVYQVFDVKGNRIMSVPETLIEVDSLPEPEPAPPAPPVYPQFTALEMLDLFTEAEQLAVVAATLTSPAVKLWYDRLIAATYVTYEDPRTEGGLQALVDGELITPERKDEIVQQMLPEELRAPVEDTPPEEPEEPAQEEPSEGEEEE